MSVDIEDWFHLLETPVGSNVSRWSQLESRMEEPVKEIIDILKSCNGGATFFVVGWVAKEHPEIVKLISDAGFEVACQSMNHSLISGMTEKQFYDDTRIAIDAIEQVIGKKVISYRAPGFSIKEGMRFVWPVLAEMGIERDSSLFLPKSGHGGVSELPSLKPFKIEINGVVIKEYPVIPFVYSGVHIPYSGGGYFRLWPYSALNYFTKSADYMMAYIHPRDIDFKQPLVQDLNLLRKFKSYYGIKSARNKFARWLSDFYFCDLNEFDQKYDWAKTQEYNYLNIL